MPPMRSSSKRGKKNSPLAAIPGPKKVIHPVTESAFFTTLKKGGEKKKDKSGLEVLSSKKGEGGLETELNHQATRLKSRKTLPKKTSKTSLVL